MIEKKPFGNTKQVSTRTIFGAAALSMANQEEADRTLDVLLEYGINHIDTAATYGDSELRIGPWMARHRQDFFLATKVEERTYQPAREQFQRSLERLQVDRVDLLQLHNVSEPEIWETVFGAGGALEAVIEAREQGLARFIGITGHGIQIARLHLRALERFDFDSVLLPYNYMMMQNAQYAAEFESLVAKCQERNIAVQTIKSLARGAWGDKPQTRNTWYEPLEEQADIARAVHWVLGREQVFLNTVADTHLLPKVLDAATRFQTAPSDDEMQEMATRLNMKPLFT